jgi:hypothetical protein
MSPYEILGIPEGSSPEQIKTAYRKLVKQYHPDRNGSEEAARLIVLINEAYDRLTDPTSTPTPVVDVMTAEEQEQKRRYEEYKAAYLRKKKQQEAEAKEFVLRVYKFRYKLLRWASFLIIPFSLLLIVDQLLPGQDYLQTAVNGWQERRGYSTGKYHYRQGELESYMETQNFVMRVPSVIHIEYDYSNPGKIVVKASPIMKIPKSVWVMTKQGCIHLIPGIISTEVLFPGIIYCF